MMVTLEIVAIERNRQFRPCQVGLMLGMEDRESFWGTWKTKRSPDRWNRFELQPMEFGMEKLWIRENHQVGGIPRF